MAEPERTSKAVREWIAGLLLPLTIFVYTYQKDKSDGQQRELDRITTVIRSLGSTSQEERSLARSYVQYLAQKGQAPPEVVTLLSSNVSTASTPTESAAAVRALQVVQKADPTLAQLVQNAVNDLPVRLYLQIRSENDRPTAEQVQKLLSAKDLTLPGVEVVSVGPDTSEIRYFHSTDKPEAEALALRLTNAGIKTVPKDATGFAHLINSSVPQKQLELWLSPGAKLAPPA